MAELSVEELVERIRAGEPLEQIARSRLSETERELFKRCSAVRSFDGQLYTSALAPDNAVDFEEFVESPDVEPVPGQTDAYRLQPRVRQAHLDAWWLDVGDHPSSGNVPEELGTFTAELVAYYERAGQPQEQLYQLTLIDPRRAGQLFDTLFRR